MPATCLGISPGYSVSIPFRIALVSGDRFSSGKHTWHRSNRSTIAIKNNGNHIWSAHSPSYWWGKAHGSQLWISWTLTMPITPHADTGRGLFILGRLRSASVPWTLLWFIRVPQYRLFWRGGIVREGVYGAPTVAENDGGVVVGFLPTGGRRGGQRAPAWMTLLTGGGRCYS